jgi:general secretion pathway protein J
MSGVSSRPAESADAAFTLVEALVSLFVFSLIAAGSVAMLMQGVASQRVVVEQQTALRELGIARALLSADALQTVPRATREADGARAPVFAGGDASGVMLHLVRGSADIVSDGKARSRTQVVEYRLKDGAMIRSSRDALDPAGGTDVSERVLFRRINNARVEFFDGAEWRGEWVAREPGNALPRAIAVTGEVPRYGEVRIVALVGPST